MFVLVFTWVLKKDAGGVDEYQYTIQLSRFFSGVAHDLTFSPAVS